MAPETRSKRFNQSTKNDLDKDPESKRRRKWVHFGQESSFKSKSCMERYHSRFNHGEIVPGRFIDLGFFNKEGFQFGKWFQGMNWVSFVLLKEKFYPELVKHFYANLSYDADKTQIHSFVKGREIKLNHKCLNRILGIPDSGTEIYQNDDKWIDDGDDVGVSRVEAFRMILDDPDLSQVSSKVNSCHLKLEMRLLHHMVVHAILPRKRNFNFVSDMDLLVMWHVVKGRAFNLPFLLLSHMIACSEKKNAYLPYGMMLTLIFKHFEVSLEEEESKELKGSNVYNEVTLHKMGYVKSENGWFLKKDKAVAQSSLEIQSEEKLNVTENQDSPSQPPYIAIPAHADCVAIPKIASSASPDANFVLSAEEGWPSEGAKQPTVVQGVLLLVRGMKEDMRTMTMDSRLDALQRKIEDLRYLVTLLGSKQQESAIGDIFLLLEVIMGDMRILRSEMDTFGSKIGDLISQLNEFLGQSQILGQVDRELIELMIAETVTFQGRNQDIVGRFETIRSEIQDFWDC